MTAIKRRANGSIRFIAKIKKNRRTFYLGTYETREEAAQVEQTYYRTHERPDNRPSIVKKAASVIGEENLALLYKNSIGVVTKRRK